MKRPWNIISPPVYSLVTYDDEGKVNMNICTYIHVYIPICVYIRIDNLCKHIYIYM